jgi:hypothetical protein
MTRTNLIAFLLVSACGTGQDGEAVEPIEDYACVHIVQGDIVDAATDRADATTIEVGRDPYRVNLPPGEAGFVRFESGATDLVLLLDFAGAAKAVWSGEDRQEITPGGPDDTCPTDIVEADYLSVPDGEHWLELGPAYQANVWLVLGEP